jgi:hypothetical protein
MRQGAMLRTATLLWLALLLGACTPLPREHRHGLTIELSQKSRPTTYSGLPLHSGQLVLSESGGPVSLLFSLFVDQFSPYVHAGILVMEDGKPIIYEARGHYRLEPGTVPTDAIEGTIRRRHLASLVRRQNYVSIYDPPPGTDVAAMVKFAQQQYADHLPFDPYFDTEDRSQVYCTEFLAMALEAGGVTPPAPVPLRVNPSLATVWHWLKLRSNAVYIAQTMTSPERHVATLSRRLTATQIRLYQAGKRELYRRFSADQKLGNLFTWTGHTLKYRPEIRSFLTRVIHLGADQDNLSEARAQAMVTALARRMFGPYTGSGVPATLARNQSPG